MELTRQFLSAARSGNEVTLRTLLPYTTENTCDEEENTAVSYAAAAGQLGTLTLLLETAKADPGKGNTSGWTPLMQAAARGHTEVVRKILAFYSPASNDGNHGNHSIHGNDGNDGYHDNNYYEMSPVVLAASNGHTETTILLLERATRKEQWMALCYAALHGHLPIVQHILTTTDVIAYQGAREDDGSWGVIEYGILSGKARVCREILAHTTLENTARALQVLRAVEGDQKGALMALIAESLPDSSEAISEAIKDGDLNILKELVGQLESPDSRLKGGGTPLMFAAVIGQLDIIKWLLDEDGIDINSRCDKNQWTALMQAVFHGHYRVVEYLLFAGADPDIGNEEGLNAHSIAAMLDDEYLSEMLIKLGKGSSGKKWWGKLAGKFSTIRALTAFKGKLKEQREEKEAKTVEGDPVGKEKSNSESTNIGKVGGETIIATNGNETQLNQKSEDESELDPSENTTESTEQLPNNGDNIGTKPHLNGKRAASKPSEDQHGDNMTPEEQHLRHHDTHSVPDELPPHNHVITVQPIILEEEGDEEVVVEDVSPSEEEEEEEVPAADSGIGSGLTHGASIDLTEPHPYDGLDLAGIPELPVELGFLEPDLWAWLPSNPQLAEDALVAMGAPDDIVRELAELELLVSS